jgi:hypothetical protein
LTVGDGSQDRAAGLIDRKIDRLNEILSRIARCFEDATSNVSKQDS